MAQDNASIVRGFVDEVITNGNFEAAAHYVWEDVVDQVPLPGSQSPRLHAHRQIPGWANTSQMHRRERGPGRSAPSSAVKLAVARVGKRPKDDASVFIDGTSKIHREGENNDKEEKIDAKQRMQ
jgi:hypothetical protein